MVKHLSFISLFFLILFAEGKRTLMLLEELTSQEAKEFLLRKQSNNTSEAPDSFTSTESSNTTSSSSSEDFDEPTPDLISSLATSALPKSVLPDYDATKTIITENFNAPETVTSEPRPMLLSEFANHLANGIRDKPETTTQPLPEFPTPRPTVFTALPDESFPYMVTAAKEFIRRYLSPEQWRKLRILLKTIREVGGSRVDVHRAATTFISKVISKTEMAEITKQKSELFRTFNKRYFDEIHAN